MRVSLTVEVCQRGHGPACGGYKVAASLSTVSLRGSIQGRRTKKNVVIASKLASAFKYTEASLCSSS